MNDGGHMHGMAAPPPLGGGNSSNGTMMHRRHMMMHMTFFWGKNAEILFDGWPGYDHLGMYVLALAVVFFLALAVEWLSHCNILRPETTSSRRQGSAAAAIGVMQTVLYAVRIGLAYLVMLAVMSFNAGVFLVAIAGHGVGFFLFGNKQNNNSSGKTSDLPPAMNC